MDSNFPTLLTRQATLIGSLTRYDLALLGVSYLTLSWLQVSGAYSIGINLILLITFKFIQRRLQVGFFRFLLTKRCLEWRYSMGNKNG